LFEHFAPKPSLFPQSRFLYSSFGGGNRGILLLGPIAFLVSLKDNQFLPGILLEKNVLIDYFSIMDMGYFAPYIMLVVGWDMRRCAIKKAPKNLLCEHILFISLLIGAVVSGIGLQHTQLGPPAHSALSEIRPYISSLMMLSSTIYIILKAVKYDFGFADIFYHFVIFWFSRGVGFMVLFFIVFGLAHIYHFSENILWAAVVCLLAMSILPPSSLADKFAGKSGLDKDKVAQMSVIVGVSNLFFLFIAMGFWGLIAIFSEVISVLAKRLSAVQ
jgi:hypothetical protein